MRRVWKGIGRLVLVAVAAVLLLLSPVAYVEGFCRGEGEPSGYAPLLAAEHHRPEVNTLLTYPEWHIVHAYDDYARVIATQDPHRFNYLSSIAGFWSSLCALSKRAPALEGDASTIEQTVHVIGVSFTAELLLKAAYEETVGRLFAALRGDRRSPLDVLSAEQAARYAVFLQQVPWYRWDFDGDIAALDAASTGTLRDRERRVALGIEYGGKSAYAGVIASAVAGMEADALTLRMVLRGVPVGALAALPDVTVIGEREEGVVIETPRYRALTHLLADLAGQGAEFVEIAGNDDILLTATSADAAMPGALFTFRRQGYGDYRHLIVSKVADLADTLRGLSGGSVVLEHVHDY